MDWLQTEGVLLKLNMIVKNVPFTEQLDEK
jgi:hypothetical protein